MHLCNDGLGHNGCARVYTRRDEMSEDWNGRRWHLFNPAASGLLQIKSIFNKSPEQLTFWEVDVELSGCLSGNIHLIFPQLGGEKKTTFVLSGWAQNIMFGYDWGKAACLNALVPPPPPPLLVFSEHMCYILHCTYISHSRRLAHSLIWRWVGGIKILIEQLATEIHHFRAALSLWWLSIEQRPENKLCLVSEGEWTVAKQKWVGSLGLAS